jgi:hypothetical protein
MQVAQADLQKKLTEAEARIATLVASTPAAAPTELAAPVAA